MNRFRKCRKAIPRWIALFGYVFIVLGPFLALGFATVQALIRGEFDGMGLLVPGGRQLALLKNSILLGVGVSGIATCLGWIGAVALWSLEKTKIQSLIWLVLPLSAIPPYIFALTWMSVAASISKFLGNGATRFLQGWGGAFWVEIAAFSPLALGFAWIGLRGIDPELIEIGRISRPDFQTLLHIVLPLSIPAALTGGGIIFLFSILDYGIPSLFQVDVYALEIFAEFSASNRPERAFLLAMPLLILAIIVIVGLLSPLRKLTSRQVLHRPAWGTRPSWPSWAITLGWVVGSVFVFQAIIPILTVTVSGDPTQYIPNIIQSQDEIWYSLKLAILSGFFSLPLAFGMAQILLGKGGHGRKFLWFLILAPVAMPASLVGVSHIFLFYRQLSRWEFLLAWMPILVNMARFMPLAVLILMAQLRRTDSLLFDASQVFQPSVWRRTIQVSAPIYGPGFIAAAGIVFIFTLGELGATLMVIPPGESTLTIRIYNYLHYGASSTVMGLSLVLVGSVLLVGGGMVVLVSRWSHLFTKSGVRS